MFGNEHAPSLNKDHAILPPVPQGPDQYSRSGFACSAERPLWRRERAEKYVYTRGYFALELYKRISSSTMIM